MASAFLAIDRISRHHPRKANFHDQQKRRAGKRQISSKPEFKRALAIRIVPSYLMAAGNQEAGSATNETLVRSFDSITKSRSKRRYQEMGIGNANQKEGQDSVLKCHPTQPLLWLAISAAPDIPCEAKICMSADCAYDKSKYESRCRSEPATLNWTACRGNRETGKKDLARKSRKLKP